MPSAGMGFVLTSNRDESPKRRTIPPRIYHENGTELLFPKDELAGGTWVGASRKERLICLLNGGFTSHVRQPKYRLSRGVVVTRLLSSDDAITEISDFDFHDIEPFTMIIADWRSQQRLNQAVWTGSELHVEEIPWAPRIWSSSLLYTAEMKSRREKWFSEFLFETLKPSGETLLNFHKTAGEGDPEIDLLIDRGYVRTKSISQFQKNGSTNEFFYEDLEEGEVTRIEF